MITFSFNGEALFCPNRPMGDSSNACASTEFVQNALGGIAGGSVIGPGTTVVGHLALWANTTGTMLSDSAALPDGTLATTQSPGDATTKVATDQFVGLAITAALSPYALLNSPIFVGNPRAPTATFGDNTISIATTEFVQAAVSGGMGGFAPINSPTFTGDPKAPTPSTGDNDTSIATTAFVKNVVASYLPLAGGIMTGNLNINAASPGIALNKAASGLSNLLVGYTNMSERWVVRLGNDTAESGSNAGSDFTIENYSDASSVIGTPFTIIRSTGAIGLAGPTTITSTSPNALAVGRNGTTNPVLQVDDSSSGAVTGVRVAGTSAAGGAYITALSTGTDESLQIASKGAAQLVLNNHGLATGSVAVGNLLDLSAATAGQIAFPASQNPSAGANVLDDYEEGTWTPGISCANSTSLSVGYANQVGTYVKVGRLVTAFFDVVTSSFTWSTASGAVSLTGNPFTISGSPTMDYSHAVESQGWSKAGKSTIHWNTNGFEFAGNNVALATANIADFASGGTVVFRGMACYFASA